MTRAERNRSSRRTTIIAMGVSGVLHAAALLWLALPAAELPAPAQRLVVLPALINPVLLDVEVRTPTVTAAAQAPAAEAGGAGLPGAASAAPPRPAPQAANPDAAVAPRPVAGEQFALAAQDSLMRAEVAAQPAAETAPVVVATLPAGESAGAGQTAKPAPTGAAHVPGSAAKAKGGGYSPGSGGSGSNDGFGGITIKVGGGGPKKHPPRGMPGRW